MGDSVNVSITDITFFKMDSHIDSRCTALRDRVWTYNLNRLFNTEAGSRGIGVKTRLRSGALIMIAFG
ncbi:hypothetical protein EMIT0P253_480010 [Pseudomonas sp. IT-P253]|jgi:hypothetical protein